MTYVQSKTFKGQDYSETPFEKGEYEDCRFINCSFAQQDLSEVKFVDCVFEDADLSNANIRNTRFNDCSFLRCKMLGLAFDFCNAQIFSIKCEDCALNHSIFYKMKLSNSEFINCEMREVDFAEAEMKGTVLVACNLGGAIFYSTNLEKADLRQSLNYNIDPDSNKLRGAKFTAPEVLSLLRKYGLKIEWGPLEAIVFLITQ